MVVDSGAMNENLDPAGAVGPVVGTQWSLVDSYPTYEAAASAVRDTGEPLAIVGQELKPSKQATDWRHVLLTGAVTGVMWGLLLTVLLWLFLPGHSLWLLALCGIAFGALYGALAQVVQRLLALSPPAGTPADPVLPTRFDVMRPVGESPLAKPTYVDDRSPLTYEADEPPVMEKTYQVGEPLVAGQVYQVGEPLVVEGEVYQDEPLVDEPAEVPTDPLIVSKPARAARRAADDDQTWLAVGDAAAALAGEAPPEAPTTQWAKPDWGPSGTLF